jgi:hypothetical protein
MEMHAIQSKQASMSSDCIAGYSEVILGRFLGKKLDRC